MPREISGRQDTPALTAGARAARPGRRRRNMRSGSLEARGMLVVDGRYRKNMSSSLCSSALGAMARCA